MRMFFACVALSAIAVAFCAEGNVRADAAPMRVLFIGNSYTLFNDMPETVAAMGRSLGYDIRPEVCAVGGASFADHRRSAKTLEAIASEPWNAVVLQDYSLDPGARPAEVRKRSLPEARALASLIRKNRASTRIIYYATWGRRIGDLVHCLTYPKVCTFDGHTSALKRGYRMYQQATGGAVASVGANWQRVVHDSPSRRPFAPGALWLNDGSHPSPLGSYLAAATILRELISVPVGPSDYSAGLPPTTAKYLRDIADTESRRQDRH